MTFCSVFRSLARFDRRHSMPLYVVAALLLIGCQIDGRYVDVADAMDAPAVDSAPSDADPNLPDASEPTLYVYISELKMTELLNTSQSGVSIAAEPGRLFVGTPVYATASGSGGAAGVFVKNAASWVPSAILTGAGQTSQAYFGSRIVIRGDTMIVAAHEQDVRNIAKAGGIFVFNRRGAVWEQVALLSSVNTTTSGTRIVAGTEYTAQGDANGEIDVFEKTGAVWVPQTPITVPKGFGRIVATEGDVIATGGADEVILLGKAGETWAETSRLAGTAASEFGARILLRDGLLFVAAPNDTGTGSVYVYELVDEVWTERARLTPSGNGVEGGRFGDAMDFAAGTLVVGAPAVNSSTGAVFLFERVGSTWFQHPRISALGGAAGDTFGWSVAVATDGSNFVVGSRKRQSAYIYERVVP
jgi:hypothetical protein